MEDLADFALLDNRIGAGTDTGIHKQFCDIKQTTGGLINQVIALAIAIEPAGELDFGIIQIFGRRTSVLSRKHQ